MVLEWIDRRHVVATCWNQFILSGNGVTDTNLARIYIVVIKIFILKDSVFITDKAVGAELCRIKFNLNLYIFGQSKHGFAHLFDHDLFCFQQIVDIGIISMALVR